MLKSYITNLVSRIKLWFNPPTVPTPPPKRYQVPLIQSDLIRYVHRGAYALVTVETLFTSIQQYTRKLQHANEMIALGHRIYRPDVVAELQTVSVREFFLSTKGEYLDEVKSIQLFLLELDKLFSHYEEIENKLTEVVNQHNHMALRFLIQNATDVTRQLEKLCEIIAADQLT